MKIVVLGFGELSPGGWTNPQWMANSLAAEGYDVTYFNPPAYRAPRFSDLRRLIYRIKSSGAIYAFQVFNLYYPFRFIGDIFSASLKKELNRADIIFVFHPGWLRCVKNNWIRGKKVIYFKTDDYESIAAPASQIHYAEKRLVGIASYVCVTSRNLLRGLTHEIYYPNCIPAYLLDKRPTNEAAFAQLSGDRVNVCYVGAVWDDKVDVEMLMEAISRCHSVHFHFAGKILSTAFLEFIRDKNKSNVTYHGVLPFDMGFELMRACDLGLMPFLINKYTDSMFSMKFFEYVAAGIPVLTTNIKMLDFLADFRQVYEVADIIDDTTISRGMPLSRNIDAVRPLLQNYTYESRLRDLKRRKIL